MAEIEPSVLNHLGLPGRVPDFASMCRECTAWNHRRNTEGGTIDWRFTTTDARIKLKRLYPRLQH